MIRNVKITQFPSGETVVARKGSWELATFSSPKAARFSMRFSPGAIRTYAVFGIIHYRDLKDLRRSRLDRRGIPHPVRTFDEQGNYIREQNVPCPDFVRSCRACGCTDDDCSNCIARTGKPCHWVDATLCSACANDAAGIRQPTTITMSAELSPPVCPLHPDDAMDLIHSGPPRPEDLQSWPRLAAETATEVFHCHSCSFEIVRPLKTP